VPLVRQTFPVGALGCNCTIVSCPETREALVIDPGDEGPEILATLARDPGVVFSRELLMDRVWGYRDYAGGRVVDSHVARIRRKLGEDGNEPRFIRTIHGVGYAFQEQS